MKRTAFVISALLFATQSFANSVASNETTQNLTLAAVDAGYQSGWTAPANRAARTQPQVQELSIDTEALTQSVNADLEQRLNEKLNIEFDFGF